MLLHIGLYRSTVHIAMMSTEISSVTSYKLRHEMKVLILNTKHQLVHRLDLTKALYELDASGIVVIQVKSIIIHINNHSTRYERKK